MSLLKATLPSGQTQTGSQKQRLSDLNKNSKVENPSNKLPPPKLENLGFDKTFLELKDEKSEDETGGEEKPIDLSKMAEIDFSTNETSMSHPHPQNSLINDFLFDDPKPQVAKEPLQKFGQFDWGNVGTTNSNTNQALSNQLPNQTKPNINQIFQSNLSDKNSVSGSARSKKEIIERNDFLDF